MSTGLRSRRWWVAGMLLMLALWGMIGCEVSSNNKADLRVVHLSPDAPALDVFFFGDAQRLIPGLSFPTGSLYQKLDADVSIVEISLTGATAGNNIVRFENVMLLDNAAYTIVIYNALASIAGLLFEDNLSSPTSGSLRLRVMHAAAGLGQLDVYNILAAGSPSLLYPNLNVGVAGDAVELPAGTYTLGIDLSNDGVSEHVFALPSLTAGTVVNIFATTDNGSNVFLLLQFADSTTQRIDPS